MVEIFFWDPFKKKYCEPVQDFFDYWPELFPVPDMSRIPFFYGYPSWYDREKIGEPGKTLRS